MKLLVPNCYDNHVHWLSTGQAHALLDLRSLSSPQEIQGRAVTPDYFRGEWLLGYGWDHNRWATSSEPRFPTKSDLDVIFPHTPVCFKRVDGHAIWVNSATLKKIGLDDGPPPQLEGGQVVCDEQGFASGVFIDNAMDLVLSQIPKFDKQEIKKKLNVGMRILNQEGFTHIRDMSCDEGEWQAKCELADEGKITLAVEQYFHADEKSIDKATDLLVSAQRERRTLLRPQGIKIFFDGALGSEGALLSQPYSSGNGYGLQLLSREQLVEIMLKVWRLKLDLAIHVIGDEAVHQVVSIATWVVQKYLIPGVLHLEHIEVMRPETLQIMKKGAKSKLLQIHCHMQPCHWLSDQVWLRSKIGCLYSYAFPWRSLENSGIALDFGSDSPIEQAHLFANIRAVEGSAKEGVKRTKKNPLFYQSHGDGHWVPHTFSEFQDEKLSKLFFAGKEISVS